MEYLKHWLSFSERLTKLLIAIFVAVATANRQFDSSRIKQGGLQDFDGEDAMDNQLHRDEFVENRM